MLLLAPTLTPLHVRSCSSRSTAWSCTARCGWRSREPRPATSWRRTPITRRDGRMLGLKGRQGVWPAVPRQTPSARGASGPAAAFRALGGASVVGAVGRVPIGTGGDGFEPRAVRGGVVVFVVRHWLSPVRWATWTGGRAGSGGGRTRSAVAANVIGTGRSAVATWRGAVRATRLPARSRANGAQREDGHSGRQAAWTEIQ